MKAVVDICDLSKRFGSVSALDGVTMQIQAGQVHGFLGPNGAGKTTMIRTILGLLRPSSGTATVFGLNPVTAVREVHSRLAYIPGDVTLWPQLTGGEAIDVLGRLHGRKLDTTKWLTYFDLDPTRKYRTYSKGNRQKVALVAAFAVDAELMIMDEPTSGLDPLMERMFAEAVLREKKRGKTILLSSHILSEAERLCDWVSIIRAGKLVDSAPLAELRDAHHTVVTATAPHLPDLSGPGVEVVDRTADHICVRVGPDALPVLLGKLSSLGVRTIEASPPSLEDVFLSHYTNDVDR